MQKKLECPRCASKRMEEASRIGRFFIGLIVMSCFIWVIFIIPVVGIIGVVIGALIMVLGPIMPKTVTCKDCKKVFSLEELKKELEA